jgi:4-hydroxythreonine-4-phosphate dehydrogenase
VSATAGAAAYAYLRRSIDLALAGAVDGIVTAPLHKGALAAAGVPFPGHTEMLAHHAGVAEVAMMLATPELRVVLATIHEPLATAIARLDRAMERRAIRFAAVGARAFGVKRPRIAVAGLNPHAGEGGRFGREEIEVIAPAVAAARADGLDVVGPLPGDTVFLQAREGRFDVVVAQYHDQGLIPVKLGGLAHGVNVTLGLPFVRTSPDHGTAFDIADRLAAAPSSLTAAIATAGHLAVQNSIRHSYE